MSLRTLLEEAAADLDGVEETGGQDLVEWSRGGRVFAVATDETGEFRLDPLVVKAALRTPDTSVSPRGTDWVHFAPAELDDHAADRAEAWLASAWRRAGT